MSSSTSQPGDHIALCQTMQLNAAKGNAFESFGPGVRLRVIQLEPTGDIIATPVAWADVPYRIPAGSAVRPF